MFAQFEPAPRGDEGDDRMSESKARKTPRKTSASAGRRRARATKGRAKPRVRRERRPAVLPEPLDEFGGGPVPRRPAARNGSTVRTIPAPRPLNIVMVGWEWPPHHTGGLGVHSFEISKELTRLGHRITFLTPFSGPFTPVPGVTIRFPGEQTGTVAPEYPPAYWTGEPRIARSSTPRTATTPGSPSSKASAPSMSSTCTTGSALSAGEPSPSACAFRS